MPTASPLFVDKIALTIALDNEDARHRIEEWFHDRPDEFRGYRVSATRGGRFYSFSTEIIFNAETHCKLLAEYLPRAGARNILSSYDGDAESEPDADIAAITDTRRPFRIEFNPAQLLAVPEYQAAFVGIMRLWFGEAQEAELSNANITRIDFATDIEHVDIANLAIARNDTTVSSATYGRDGRIETIYLGDKNSGLRFAIYDKQAQRGGMVPLTRIEARIKQRLTLESIYDYANPFDRLLIREISRLEVGTSGNGRHYWDWFVSACQLHGLQMALGSIRNHQTRGVWRNKVAAREAPTWWNPQALWQHGLREAISRIELWPTRRRVRRFRY